MALCQVNVGIVKHLFSLSLLSLILEVVEFLFVCMVWFSLVLCLLVFFSRRVSDVVLRIMSSSSYVFSAENSYEEFSAEKGTFLV